MMMNHPINIHLDHFDGPLSLLLYLIQKEEMRLDQLDLTKVTQKYLQYLKMMQELDFDVAGEFLYMAASLVLIKSRESISDDLSNAAHDLDQVQTESDLQTPEDLAKKLRRLQLFQQLGKKLWELPKRGHEVFLRKKLDRKKLLEQFIKPMDKHALVQEMIEFLKRDKRKFALVKRDRLSIKEKLLELKQKLKKDETQLWSQLKSLKKDIIDEVITFISLLELARLKKVSLMQIEARGEIYIEVLADLDSFDVNAADGFEEESPPAAFLENAVDTITENVVTQTKENQIEEINYGE